jgi:hypothetical protein
VASAAKESEAVGLATVGGRLALVKVLVGEADALSDELEIRVVAVPVGASVVTAVHVHASRIRS